MELNYTIDEQYVEDEPQRRLSNEMVEYLLSNSGTCPDRQTVQKVRQTLKKFILEMTFDSSQGVSSPGNTKLRTNTPIVELDSRCGRIWNNSCFLQPSRYQTDYVDVQLIAEGGFGFVCKVKSVIDASYYALKIVPFRYKTQKAYEQIMREVEAFARLPSHSNLVTYKTSFLERCIQRRKARTGLPTSSQSDSSIGSSSQESDCSDGPSRPKMSKFENLSSISSATSVNFCLTDASSKYNDDRSWESMEISAQSSSTPLVVLSQPDSSAEEDYDYETHLGAALYIQMELCEGNLRTWLNQRNETIMEQVVIDKMDKLVKPLVKYIDGALCLSLFKQTLLGMKLVHENGLIHRDLKPQNIFFGYDGRLKIGDFGLATYDDCVDVNAMVNGKPGFDYLFQRHTKGVGTVGYAAPEQRNSKYDQKADIYSLGIILLELFYPFASTSEKLSNYDSVKRTWSVPSELKREFPLVADKIIRMTALDSKQRPDVNELLDSDLFSAESNIIDQLKRRLEYLESVIREKSEDNTRLEKEKEEIARALKMKDDEIERLKTLTGFYASKF